MPLFVYFVGFYILLLSAVRYYGRDLPKGTLRLLFYISLPISIIIFAQILLSLITVLRSMH